ncbi:hypothetical protein ACUY2E_10415 [Corynebacterium confusum]
MPKATITRTHFDHDGRPVTVTLPETSLADATTATLRHAEKKYKHAKVVYMFPERVGIRGFNDPDHMQFGQGYYLNITQQPD